MTAHTVIGDLEKCIEIGMDEYIPKPFNATDLYEKIDKVIKLKKQVS